jgi:transposase-like protein
MEIKKIKCPYCQSERVREYRHGQASGGTQGKYIKADHISGDGNPRFLCDDCGRDFGEVET